MKLRMPNYKQDFKNINENLDNISTEIKELKNLMIKLWRAEDMEENSGKFRWPFDEHGNVLDNVNLSEGSNGIS
jgi:beta-mannanase